jgi:hypothetical protein
LSLRCVLEATATAKQLAWLRLLGKAAVFLTSVLLSSAALEQLSIVARSVIASLLMEASALTALLTGSVGLVLCAKSTERPMQGRIANLILGNTSLTLCLDNSQRSSRSREAQLHQPCLYKEDCRDSEGPRARRWR